MKLRDILEHTKYLYKKMPLMCIYNTIHIRDWDLINNWISTQ